ncbi:MAG: DDE-type integrase/transposase/recombinase, partial [Clostridiales bacterium]|nr:DDE-type integrase/transposase/recombinase [Clostridiales bacterium]
MWKGYPEHRLDRPWTAARFPGNALLRSDRAPAGGETTGCADQIQNAAQKSPSALPADGGSCQRAGTGSRPPGVVVFLHGLPSVCVKRNHGFSFLRIQIVLRIVPCRSDRCACGEAQEPPVFVKRSQCNPVYPVSPPGFSAELQLHSDQGFQYTSQAYFNLIQQYGITPSMSRRGNPYDNAMAENFFSILKTECIYRHK